MQPPRRQSAREGKAPFAKERAKESLKGCLHNPYALSAEWFYNCRCVATTKASEYKHRPTAPGESAIQARCVFLGPSLSHYYLLLSNRGYADMRICTYQGR